MAKADVTMKFDAETADFINKMMGMRNEILNTANATRDVGAAAQKSGSLMDSFSKVGAQNMQTLQGTIMGAVGGLNAMGLAIGVVESAYDRWKQKIKEVYEDNEKLRMQAARIASGFGDAGSAKEIDTRLKNAFMPGVGLEQRFEMVKQAQSMMPGATKDRVMEMVLSAGEANRGGKDPTALLSTMSRMSHLFKDATVGGLRDKAATFMEEAGGRELDESTMNAALRFSESGAGTADEGLGQALALIKSGGSPQTLGKLVDKLKNLKPKKLHEQKDRLHALSQQQLDENAEFEKYNAFAALSMKEKLARVFGSSDTARDILGEEDASEIFPSGSKIAAAQGFGPDKIAKRLQRSGGAFEKTAREFANTNPQYERDLASQEWAEDARINRLKKDAPIQRDMNDIISYLKERGDNPTLIKAFEEEMKLGSFFGGNPIGQLPKDLAIDFQQKRQQRLDQVQHTGAYSEAARAPQGGISTPISAGEKTTSDVHDVLTDIRDGIQGLLGNSNKNTRAGLADPNQDPGDKGATRTPKGAGW